ncbi:MAG: hypothetical protein ACK5HR_03965 [Mycoplasmatales bacterium]
MNNKTITYKNKKYHFKCIVSIKSLSQKDVIKFQKLFYTNQISKKDYTKFINIIKEQN